MDSMDWFLLVLCGIYVVAIVGFTIRELHFGRKEGMRAPRTEGLVSGKEVVVRMLDEAGIDDVAVVPKDAVIQRYYYSPRKKRIVISTHACYNSGYYEVMRAATTAANAVQHEEGFGMIDLYLWLAPVMEWMSRMLPLFLLAGLYVIYLNPMLIGVSLLSLWVLMLLLALLMRTVDKDAAQRSSEWLIANGLVAESERKKLDRIGRYLTNYNLVLVLTAGFAVFFLSYKMRVPSDKSV